MWNFKSTVRAFKVVRANDYLRIALPTTNTISRFPAESALFTDLEVKARKIDWNSSTWISTDGLLASSEFLNLTTAIVHLITQVQSTTPTDDMATGSGE